MENTLRKTDYFIAYVSLIIVFKGQKSKFEVRPSVRLFCPSILPPVHLLLNLLDLYIQNFVTATKRPVCGVSNYLSDPPKLINFQCLGLTEKQTLLCVGMKFKYRLYTGCLIMKEVKYDLIISCELR